MLEKPIRAYDKSEVLFRDLSYLELRCVDDSDPSRLVVAKRSSHCESRSLFISKPDSERPFAFLSFLLELLDSSPILKDSSVLSVILTVVLIGEFVKASILVHQNASRVSHVKANHCCLSNQNSTNSRPTILRVYLRPQEFLVHFDDRLNDAVLNRFLRFLQLLCQDLWEGICNELSYIVAIRSMSIAHSKELHVVHKLELHNHSVLILFMIVSFSLLPCLLQRGDSQILILFFCRLAMVSL
jgi:hypothetical protein